MKPTDHPDRVALREHIAATAARPRSTRFYSGDPLFPRSTRTHSLHNQIVRQIVERYKAATLGFRRALIADMTGPNADERERIGPEEITRLNHFPKVPDAYLIGGTEGDCRVVTVWEVENTHRVEDDKMRAYAALANLLDEYYYYLRLVVVDRFDAERCYGWADLLVATTRCLNQ